MTGGRGSKAKGASYENEVVKYLRSRGFEVTRAKIGNATGDIIGIPGVVVEAKNQKRFDVAGWVDQMLGEVEAAHARLGMVIAKRPRKVDIGENYLIMTVADGITLLKEAGLGFIKGTDC